jgi:hypothetical protein
MELARRPPVHCPRPTVQSPKSKAHRAPAAASNKRRRRAPPFQAPSAPAPQLPFPRCHDSSGRETPAPPASTRRQCFAQETGGGGRGRRGDRGTARNATPRLDRFRGARSGVSPGAAPVAARAAGPIAREAPAAAAVAPAAAVTAAAAVAPGAARARGGAAPAAAAVAVVVAAAAVAAQVEMARAEWRERGMCESQGMQGGNRKPPGGAQHA